MMDKNKRAFILGVLASAIFIILMTTLTDKSVSYILSGALGCFIGNYLCARYL